MTKSVRRWVLAVALIAAGAFSLARTGSTPAADVPGKDQKVQSAANAQAKGAQANAVAKADPTAQAGVQAGPQEVASVEQLKSEAFRALRGGQFARTNELLGRAAVISR